MGRRLALWLFVALHLSFYVSALYTDHLQHFFVQGTIQAEKTLDYSQIPNGARTLFEGDPLGVRGRKRPYPVLQNVYHPVTTIALGGLLQLFDMQTGFVAYTALKLVTTALLGGLLYRRFADHENFTLAAFVFLGFAPQAVDIACGQYHFLLNYAVFLLCWGILERKSDAWLAWTYLASLLVKPIGLLWAPNLLLAARARPALVGVGAFAVLTALGLLVPGGDYYLDQLLFYAGHPIQIVQDGVPQDGGRYTLEALVRFAGAGTDVSQAIKFGLIPVLLVGSWYFRLPLFTILFAWVGYYLLFYGRVYIYHYTTLIPFFVLGVLRQPAFQTRLAKSLIVVSCLPSPYFLFKLFGVFVRDVGHPVHQLVTVDGYLVMLCLRVLPLVALVGGVLTHDIRHRDRTAPIENPFRGLRVRHVGVAVASAVVIAAGLAAVSEVVLRWRYPNAESLSGVESWETGVPGEGARPWDAYHPQLGWTNQPGYRSGPRAAFAVRINQQGLRAQREYEPEPAPGRRRVAVFGGSDVFGDGVDDEETLPFLLEQELAGSEVINFGVQGYGPGQMALRLEAQGFAAHPDHVVVVYPTYGFVRDPSPTSVHAKPVFRAEAGKLMVENVPVPRAADQPAWLRRSYLGALLWGQQHRSRFEGRRSLNTAFALAASVLERIRAACEERGVPLTLVHIVDGRTLAAIRDSPEERQRVRRVRAALKATGIDLLDLAPPLEIALRVAEDPIVAPEGHWNGRGNRLIAGRIAAHLAD